MSNINISVKLHAILAMGDICLAGEHGVILP